MKRGFSELDIELKDIIYNAISYYEQMSSKKIYVAKQKAFSYETEMVQLDNNDLKVISIFLGILSNDNYVNKYFNYNNIDSKLVFKYLNIDLIEPKAIDRNNIDLSMNIFPFLKELINSDLNLDKLVSTLFKKIYCGSDIMYNFYFTCVSNDSSVYFSVKDDLKNFAHINNNLDLSVSLWLDTHYNYN